MMQGKCQNCFRELHWNDRIKDFDSCDCIYNGGKPSNLEFPINKCPICKKDLKYNIIEDSYEFCYCEEDRQKEVTK